jgi:hypothetical protein
VANLENECDDQPQDQDDADAREGAKAAVNQKIQ